MTSAMMVPMRVRDRVFGVISFVERGVGAALHRRRPAARGGTRAARRHRGRERPPLPRPHQDRPDAAGLAAAAAAAGGPRRRGRRAVPAGGRGARGRRRLLRPLRDDRGPLVRGHRRRLRQGRGGRGGDGAGALHDPRRGGPAATHRPRSCAGSTRRCCARTPRASARSPSRTSTAPPPTTRLTVAVGGHPAPIVLRADGSVETAGAGGTLIGLVDDPRLAETTTELAPGDAVLLYTDGVTEASPAPGVDAGGARGRGARPPRARPPRSSSTAWRTPRSAASRRRRATTSRCWRCGSAPAWVAGRGPVLVVGRVSSASCRGCPAASRLPSSPLTSSGASRGSRLRHRCSAAWLLRPGRSPRQS